MVQGARELLMAYIAAAAAAGGGGGGGEGGEGVGKSKEVEVTADEEEAWKLLEPKVEEDCAEDIRSRHWAAERGYDELLARLLSVGNNIEGVTEAYEGSTPLARALIGGHVKCVELLVENGSDVNFVFAVRLLLLPPAPESSLILSDRSCPAFIWD
eukprot:748822-Hanusia_phi.AAC.1